MRASPSPIPHPTEPSVQVSKARCFYSAPKGLQKNESIMLLINRRVGSGPPPSRAEEQRRARGVRRVRARWEGISKNAAQVCKQPRQPAAREQRRRVQVKCRFVAVVTPPESKPSARRAGEEEAGMPTAAHNVDATSGRQLTCFRLTSRRPATRRVACTRAACGRGVSQAQSALWSNPMCLGARLDCRAKRGATRRIYACVCVAMGMVRSQRLCVVSSSRGRASQQQPRRRHRGRGRTSGTPHVQP